MNIRKNILVKNILSIIFLLTTIILGVAKKYVWINFRTGAGEMIVNKYNFLSTTLLGYGLFFPLLVILITIVLLIISISRLLSSPTKKMNKHIIVLAGIDIVCLVFPVFIGMQIFNKGIAYIIALLVCNFVISFSLKNK